MVVLLIDGDHVPLIPFVDIVGNGEILAPEQYGPTCVKVGVVSGVILIVKLVVVAHCPAVGVKV